MTSLMNKVRHFLSSPEGRRHVDKGRRMTRDPRQRQRLHGLLDKLRGRHDRW
ncbi:hypothetical protein ACFMQL_26855 [Nonomuraea fastidiosa]|uniref:hypothetical protein n=1 Tax=Nonomuraea TaxID=83681 RepID=UPI003251AEF0